MGKGHRTKSWLRPIPNVSKPLKFSPRPSVFSSANRDVPNRFVVTSTGTVLDTLNYQLSNSLALPFDASIVIALNSLTFSLNNGNSHHLWSNCPSPHTAYMCSNSDILHRRQVLLSPCVDEETEAGKGWGNESGLHPLCAGARIQILICLPRCFAVS